MVILVMFGLSIFSGVHAWEKNGHWISGIIAGHLVKDSTRDFLVANIPSISGDIPRSIAWNSLWADVAAYRDPDYAWSTDLHFAYSPYKACGEYDPSVACPNGRCIVTAIANYTERASDPSLKRAEREEALKFLLHFVADFHQPLHLGFELDAGGTQVSLDDPRTTLHYVWDFLVLGELKSNMGLASYVDVGEALAGKLKTKVAAAVKIENIEKTLHGWYKEITTSVTCKYGYRHGHFGDGAWIESFDELDDDWFKARASIVQIQLAKAGTRLAAILDAVADKFVERKAALETPVSVTTGSAEEFDSNNQFAGLALLDDTDIAEPLAAEQILESQKEIDSEVPVPRKKKKPIKRAEASIDELLAAFPRYHGIDLQFLVLRTWSDGSKLFTYERIAELKRSNVQTCAVQFGETGPVVKIAIEKLISMKSDLSNDEIVIWLVNRFRSEFPEGEIRPVTDPSVLESVIGRMHLMTPLGPLSRPFQTNIRPSSEYLMIGDLSPDAKVALFTTKKILANPTLNKVWPLYCFKSRDGFSMLLDARAFEASYEAKNKGIVQAVMRSDRRVFDNRDMNGIIQDLVRAPSFEYLPSIRRIVHVPSAEAENERSNLFEITVRERVTLYL
jgi:hypothetical protein